ncbi:MAG: RluA family pseudouridine synthase [Pseudomonadota bacterium]
MTRLTFLADQSGAGQRLDRVLVNASGDLSRSRIQALIRLGHVTIDGAAVHDPSRRILLGQEIALDVPDALPSEPAAEAIPLNILYEDNDLIVVNKPAGLAVHPGAGREAGTLVNALLAHCGDSLSGVGGVKRPGIVHRLDRLTSGVMVVAKNDRAHVGLSEQFAAHGRDGRLVRRYRGLAWGRFARPSIVIDARIGRSPVSRRRMAVVHEPNGRSAITRIARAEEFNLDLAPVTEFTAELETGRTHQIRVHMTSIGHPLLGDSVYGKGFASREAQLGDEQRAALLAMDRQALHAELLGFAHPIRGDHLEFHADMPADFARLRDALRKRS